MKVIDKLEIRVPHDALFTKDFATFYREIDGAPENPFRQAQHYERVGDLRESFGIDALLHLYNRHTKEPAHKVELLDTGKKTFSHLLADVEKIFATDPRRHDVMRIDLCTDVPGVPVPWFHRSMRARYKIFASAIGKMEVIEMGRREVQTLYFGKRPNCIRVYDKRAELEYRLERLMRKMNPDLERSYKKMLRELDDDTEPPAFDVYCENKMRDRVTEDDRLEALEIDRKLRELPETYTRVERQIAGGRVPPKIQTVGSLPKQAPEFDPFEHVELNAGGIPTPSVEQYGAVDFAAGMFFRTMILEHGRERFDQWVAMYGNGNASRIRNRFRDFYPPEDSAEGISRAELYERYRDTVTRQLAN